MSMPLHLSTAEAPGSPLPHVIYMHAENGTRTALAACQSQHVRQVLIDALERKGLVSVERHAGDGSLRPSNDDGRTTPSEDERTP
jgi:hypothetical protein